MKIRIFIIFCLFILLRTTAFVHAETTPAAPHIVGWGDNRGGQLGNGIRADSSAAPIRATDAERILAPSHQVLDIASASWSGCLLRDDFTVWCWGGPMSQPGAPAQPARLVEGISSVNWLKGLRNGGIYCAGNDASLWCWDAGQINGLHLDLMKLWYIPEDTKIDYADLARQMRRFYPTHDHACATTTKGEAWCWGNQYADREDLIDDQRNGKVPVPITLPGPVKDMVVTGGDECAVLEDNSVWCWQARGKKVEPKKRGDFGTDALQVQLDSRGVSGCVVDADGTVSCWEVDRPTPEPVKTVDGKILDGVTSIVRTSMARCALRKDGSVWCWGEGALGDPDRPFSQFAGPVRNAALDGPLTNVTHLSSSALSVLAVVAGDDKPSAGTTKSQKEETPAELNGRFLTLVQSGDFEEASTLVKKITEVQVGSPVARKALSSAARAGNVTITKMLIDAYKKTGEQDGFSTITLQELTCDCIPGLRPVPEMVAMLLAAGADVLARDSDGRSALTWVMGRGRADLAPRPVSTAATADDQKTYKLLVEAASKKLGRALLTLPPDNIGLSALKARIDSCQPGKAIFDKPGTFNVTIPKGCSSILVRAWGAGGGEVASYRNFKVNKIAYKEPNVARGGAGGFSTGIFELDEYSRGEVKVIVGGPGSSVEGVTLGKGGANGGGDGGGATGAVEEGGRTGAGGGGRSELQISGKPVLIAGGGGGAGARASGGAGGGDRTRSYLTELESFMLDSNVVKNRLHFGQPGVDGNGGSGGKGSVQTYTDMCRVQGKAGEAQTGGKGGTAELAECSRSMGGGGGGAGYGGGGGGESGSDLWNGSGGGGGGAGLAPALGASFWGGMGTEPANTDDKEYVGQAGRSGKPGLIVVSWPAPVRDAYVNLLSPYKTPESKPLTMATAKPIDCPAIMQDALKAFRYFPIIAEGKMGPDGNFVPDTVYKGFHKSPLIFDIVSFGVLPDKKSSLVLMSEYDGHKVVKGQCGGIYSLKDNSIAAQVLVEAALYKAGLDTHKSRKESPGDSTRYDESERLRNNFTTTFQLMMDAGDRLHALEFSRDTFLDIYKNFMNVTPSKKFPYYERALKNYLEDRRNERTGLCAQEYADNSLYFPNSYPEMLREVIIGGRDPIGNLQEDYQKLFVEAVVSFSRVLASMGEYRAALPGICRFRGSLQIEYALAAISFGQPNLVGESELGYLGSLYDIDLSGLSLRNVQLHTVTWRGVKLSGTDLSGAHFYNAIFEDTDLQDAVLDFAVYNCETVFPKGFDPTSKHMLPTSKRACSKEPQKIDMRDYTVSSGRQIKIRSASLAGLDAARAKLGKVECGWCQIKDANFTDAVAALALDHSTVSNTSFKGADLRGSEWKETTFKNVDFTDAKLEGVRCNNCTYDATTKWPPSFDPEFFGIRKFAQ